ncbi:MAG TPA: protocatechuate 3,4-dioxygenase subunit beta [Acidimicrobiia bacterium]|nr:protocatechuate 3,4-dioxygenase subunit beta [Acidimicrobiia bacterium]
MTEPIIRHYGPRAYSDHPPFRYPEYKSTVKRSPDHDLLKIVATLSETTGPGPAWSEVTEEDADLTTNATGEAAIGERIIVTGHVLDENGKGVPGTVLEIWQANSAGRYAHWRETSFPAPMDPNFIGVGQCMTDDEGEYRFVTIRPGAYPWGNHPNAWRPAHIHLSVLGTALGQRLVTQMYFEGDPLLRLDPIYQAAPEHSRERMVAAYDHDVTEENWALGWRFDIVLRGELSTLEEVDEG